MKTQKMKEPPSLPPPRCAFLLWLGQRGHGVGFWTRELRKVGVHSGIRKSRTPNVAVEEWGSAGDERPQPSDQGSHCQRRRVVPAHVTMSGHHTISTAEPPWAVLSRGQVKKMWNENPFKDQLGILTLGLRTGSRLCGSLGAARLLLRRLPSLLLPCCPVSCRMLSHGKG